MTFDARRTMSSKLILLFLALLSSGCSTTRLDQIYYLGVFDPIEQVPPQFFRVVVQARSDFFSSTKFASGWAPAALVDSLQSDFTQGFEAGGRPGGPVGVQAGKNLSSLATGRRLVLFGPEGFREAPAEHRLVLVMGATPEAFFQAIDDALGKIAGAQFAGSAEALDRDLFRALSELSLQSAVLEQVDRDLELAEEQS